MKKLLLFAAIVAMLTPLHLEAKTLSPRDVAPSANPTARHRDFVKARKSAFDIKGEGLRESPSHEAPPTGEWKSLGEGTYCEDLLTYYHDFPVGMRWNVQVEESESTPGWYRFQPYCDGSKVAEIMGATDPSYIYINATDPAKVYVEDIFVYNAYEISNLTVATGWPDDGKWEYYGKLADGIISFEPGSFGIGVGTGWQRTSNFDGFKLALPGFKIPDYSLKLTAPYCAEDNDFTIEVHAGESIEPYIMVVSGEHYIYDEGIGDELFKDENKFDPKKDSFKFKPTDAGLYTVIAAGLDEKGELVVDDSEFIVAVSNDDSKWKSIGKGTLTEAFYSSLYDEIPVEDIVVDIDERTDKPGYFRVRNPYGSHSQLSVYTFDCQSHGHYLYINASDPDRVWIDPSVTGVDYVCGEGVVWSQAGSCVAENVPTEEIELSGYFGSRQGREITMPDYTVLISEKDFSDSEFLQGSIGFKLELPATWSGLTDISVDSDSTEVYYNMQGVIIDKPSAPGVYICRKGDVTSKVIVK